MTPMLHETFAGPGLDPRLAWVNEPPTYSVFPFTTKARTASFTPFPARVQLFDDGL